MKEKGWGVEKLPFFNNPQKKQTHEIIEAFNSSDAGIFM
jgi:hypothetical protein